MDAFYKFSQLVASQKPLLDDVMKRRFITAPAFELYGSASGLIDLGPLASGMLRILKAYWYEFFVTEESMETLQCTNLTPGTVFENSGHVERFNDFILRDSVTHESFRADKILAQLLTAKHGSDPKVRHILRQIEGYNAKQFDALVAQYQLKSPMNNPFTKAEPFNLMFKTQIGPQASAENIAYLRPETAQGIFLSFKRLLEQNGGRLPLGVATDGFGFRNEISPRNGLLRVREFNMAEIEWFYDPQNDELPKLKDYETVTLQIYSAADQEAGRVASTLTVAETFSTSTVTSPTLLYFMARTQLFLESIGIKPIGLRFRQHQANEMAHYASDCWDAEVYLSAGWTEIVGLANRGCFDLDRHSKGTGRDLRALRTIPPREETRYDVKIDKAGIAKLFNRATQAISAEIERIASSGSFISPVEGHYKITIGADVYEIPEALLTVRKSQVTVTTEPFLPHVIEPSFGLSRILQSVLEHSFFLRADERTYFDFRPFIAPIKATVLPLSTNDALVARACEVERLLRTSRIRVATDLSGVSIGRRYSRADEIGIPFAITIDFESLEDNQVTVRHCSTMEQVRLPMAELVDYLRIKIE